ncbi:hypothetical protein [uncultured Bradyrhizobium sp.]|uniref:hypothetical protein n=1 Tax=uncultured Bradyrhizobium sp. TaxID=199684 RepID=UPI0035CC886E
MTEFEFEKARFDFKPIREFAPDKTLVAAGLQWWEDRHAQNYWTQQIKIWLIAGAVLILMFSLVPLFVGVWLIAIPMLLAVAGCVGGIVYLKRLPNWRYRSIIFKKGGEMIAPQGFPSAETFHTIEGFDFRSIRTIEKYRNPLAGGFDVNLFLHKGDMITVALALHDAAAHKVAVQLNQAWREMLQAEVEEEVLNRSRRDGSPPRRR